MNLSIGKRLSCCLLLALGGLGALSASAQTRLTAVLSVSPSSWTFPDTALGSTAQKVLTITNTGRATLSVTGTSLSSSQFTAALSGCGSVAPTRTCTVTVTFKPTAIGVQTATLRFTSNARTSASVSLSGKGVGAVLSVAPTNLNFACVTGQKTTPAQAVTATNTGNANLTFSSIALAGTGFKQVTNTCVAPLAGGARCQVSVSYTPLQAGTVSGSLTFTSNGGTKVVSLSGYCKNAVSP